MRRLTVTPTRRLVSLLAAIVVCLLAAAAPAGATTTSGTTPIGPGVASTPAGTTNTATFSSLPPVTTAEPAGTPVLVSSMTVAPKGYRLTGNEVLRIAAASPVVKAELRKHPKAEPYVYTKGAPTWQVSWFSDSKPQRELIQVYVDDNTFAVTQAWTGFQVAWTMARGYPGAFGRRVNAWYLWVALCALFFVPFLRRRPTLLHLDLLMLLGFSISLAFFNHAKIGLSVPLVYPFLIYLMVRMLLLAGGRGVPRGPLVTLVPESWLAVGTVFLMAFRIGLNVLNSNVIDVGYAGVIGADKLIHNVALYGNWPHDNMYGDTYGPFSYMLYVPFRLIFGWSGTWDSLPAAHGAAIFFDVLTVVGLFLLGRRLKGTSLGILLAYCWAAYPFTLYAMNSNTNDSLVAATLVFALYFIASAPGRGALSALAGMTKFAPFALAPLFLRGVGPPPTRRAIVWFIVAFALCSVLVMLPVLLNHDLGPFWRDSVEYQSQRITPFSVWGLWGGLTWLQNLLQGAAIALALGVAFFPSRRTVVDVAALGAAVIISLQLVANYWLYPYIVWFFPLVIFALLAAHPDRHARPLEAWAGAGQSDPVPIRITAG